MQSSVQNEVVAPSDQGQLLAAALKELESLGFLRFKQNLRLLKKTDGNLESVREYLLAKKKFRDAAMQRKREGKKDKKEKRECPCRRRKEGADKDDEKKAEKKELKALFKAGRKEMKKCHKEWKKEKPNKKEKKEEIPSHPLNVWPAEVSRLYLDGNNMIYVAKPMREKAIRHQWNSACLALASVAFEFTKNHLPAAVKTTLVYDSAPLSMTQSYRALDNFQILSARPVFATSDDALVHWAQENAALQQRNPPVVSMVVTADRGLRERLAAVPGVVIVSPKSWMTFAATMLDKEKKMNIGENNNNNNNNSVEPSEPINLDSWMAIWMQKMEQEGEESLSGRLQTSLHVSDAK